MYISGCKSYLISWFYKVELELNYEKNNNIVYFKEPNTLIYEQVG